MLKFIHFKFDSTKVQSSCSHSLANNKTVVQLPPRSTTGSGFFVGVDPRFFFRRVWSISKFCRLAFCTS